jgi:hypothetical protein
MRSGASGWQGFSALITPATRITKGTLVTAAKNDRFQLSQCPQSVERNTA